MPADKFQVKLSGEWKDFKADEDKILKRAFLAGFPNAKFRLRKFQYEVDFKNMKQNNISTGKSRDIRAPHKMKPPSAPIMPSGPAITIKVPAGSPGTTISVPHPQAKGEFIQVSVPATAKVGAAMMVPVPKPTGKPAAPAAEAPAPAPSPPQPDEKKGWSTGGKVAAGVAGVAVVGGLAVAGAILGEHIAEEGWDATMAELGDGLEHAGEAVADGAEEGAEWVGDAAEDAGDFIMDLF